MRELSVTDVTLMLGTMSARRTAKRPIETLNVDVRHWSGDNRLDGQP